MKKASVFIFFMFLGSFISCAGYEEEPPKTVNIDDYLIPASEAPTAEESQAVAAIRQEYFAATGQ